MTSAGPRSSKRKCFMDSALTWASGTELPVSFSLVPVLNFRRSSVMEKLMLSASAWMIS